MQLFNSLRKATDHVSNGLLRVRRLLKNRRAEEDLGGPPRVRFPLQHKQQQQQQQPASSLPGSSGQALHPEPLPRRRLEEINPALTTVLPIYQVKAAKPELCKGRGPWAGATLAGGNSPLMAESATPVVTTTRSPIRPSAFSASPFAAAAAASCAFDVCTNPSPLPPPEHQAVPVPPPSPSTVTPHRNKIPMGAFDASRLTRLDLPTPSTTPAQGPPSLAFCATPSFIPSAGSRIPSIMAADCFNIRWSELKTDILKMIGNGSFGQVYHAM